eukprot:g73927.t1
MRKRKTPAGPPTAPTKIQPQSSHTTTTFSARSGIIVFAGVCCLLFLVLAVVLLPQQQQQHHPLEAFTGVLNPAQLREDELRRVEVLKHIKHSLHAYLKVTEGRPHPLLISLALQLASKHQSYISKEMLSTGQTKTVNASLLHAFAHDLMFEPILLLLSQHNGWDINSRQAFREGLLPLHWAVEYGLFSLLPALLDAGADPLLLTQENHSILDLAVLNSDHTTLTCFTSHPNLSPLPTTSYPNLSPSTWASSSRPRPVPDCTVKDVIMFPYEIVQAALGLAAATGYCSSEVQQAFSPCRPAQLLHNSSAAQVAQLLSLRRPLLFPDGLLASGWNLTAEFERHNLLNRYGDVDVSVSNIPYAQVFGDR